MNRQIILIAHNLRSAHNIGSLLRTAEGLGLKTVYLTGYSPYPLLSQDQRLPHLAIKLDKRIAKTALGAEKQLEIYHDQSINSVVNKLKADGYRLVALEQAKLAVSLMQFKVPAKLALIVGREVEGLETSVLDQVDDVVEIPMLGQKESFNVAQATAMALFYCRFIG